MIAPTRGWPLPNDLIRLFQPLLPLLRHRRDQTTQEGPLGFVFVSISGLRFAIHAQTFRHPGLCYPLLPQGGSCHREGPHSSCGLLAVRLGPLDLDLTADNDSIRGWRGLVWVARPAGKPAAPRRRSLMERNLAGVE
jgi:hypothetical protein